MPTIIMLDGRRIPASYHKAARTKHYLEHPEELQKIRCTNCQTARTQCADCIAKREAQEEFIEQVADVDFSDIPKPGRKRTISLQSVAVHNVLTASKDDLYGKARFKALRDAMRQGESEGE